MLKEIFSSLRYLYRDHRLNKTKVESKQGFRSTKLPEKQNIEQTKEQNVATSQEVTTVSDKLKTTQEPVKAVREGKAKEPWEMTDKEWRSSKVGDIDV